MTEPMSDALFGVDGTELPRLSSDPSGRGSWEDIPVPPPLPLPPLPNLTMTREAVAAALGEDPGGPVDQELSAAATVAATTAEPSAPQATVTALPVAPPPAEPLPPNAASQPPQPVIAAAVSPPLHGPGGPGYRRPISGGARPRVQLRSPRRRAVRRVRGLPAQTRSNGGAGAFFVVMVIVFAVLLYFIIAGIVESFARLIP
jgi:hypothetical protein